MEGSAPDAAGAGCQPQQGGHPREHLAGRPAGKGQQQDPGRIGPPCNRPGHAVHQGGRLARAGPGHDQERAVAVRRRPALLRVEPGQQVVDRRVLLHAPQIIPAGARSRQAAAGTGSFFGPLRLLARGRTRRPKNVPVAFLAPCLGGAIDTPRPAG